MDKTLEVLTKWCRAGMIMQENLPDLAKEILASLPDPRQEAKRLWGEYCEDWANGNAPEDFPEWLNSKKEE